jgi:hypothetical protein
MAEIKLKGTPSNIGGNFINYTFPSFVGAWSWHASTAPLDVTFEFVTLELVRSSDGTVCKSTGAVINGSPGETGVIVQPSSTDPLGGYVCTDWDKVRMHVTGPGTYTAELVTLTIDGPFVATRCLYGQEPNPDAGLVIILTGAVVDAAILLLGGGILAATALDTIIGLPLLVDTTCAVPPPPLPTLGPGDFIPGTNIYGPGAIGKLIQTITAAVWSIYCRCTPAPPGLGDPIPFDPPHYPGGDLPTIHGDYPTIVCDNTNICAYLNSLARQINGLSIQLAYARQDIQLIQRQGVPFGYVAGALFSGLTGAGVLTVADILALRVDFTTIPTEPGAPIGSPDTYFGLGWLTLGTAEGWKNSIRLHHDPQLVEPIDGDITRVGYNFGLGVVADVQTFVREP